MQRKVDSALWEAELEQIGVGQRENRFITFMALITCI